VFHVLHIDPLSLSDPEGSGAMSAPIVYSTKMTPTVIGKPNKHMMDAILASKHFDPKKTVMVGDNLETDILFGQNSGIETLLVMTGEFSLFALYVQPTSSD
jgi:4-nitrophenyl phosphatase